MSLAVLRHLPQGLLRRRPLMLTYFVSPRCNARCGFCFYRGREGPELGLREVKALARSTGPLLWLALSGGEVFLRDNLVEVVEAFHEHCSPDFILVPTNGLMPQRIREATEEILKRCPRSQVVLKLSLDGPPGVHDSLRGRPGAYSLLMRTYRLLRPLAQREPRLQLGFNTVLCAQNQHHLLGLLRYVRDVLSEVHTISAVRGQVPRGFKALEPELYLRYARLLEARHLYGFSLSGLKAAQDVLRHRFVYRELRGQGRPMPCYAGRLTVVVAHDGRVYPCEAMLPLMGHLGEHGYSLRRLLRSPRAQEAVRALRHCHCSHECYISMNILFNPALYPRLFLNYLRVALLRTVRKSPLLTHSPRRLRAPRTTALRSPRLLRARSLLSQ